MRTSLSSGDEKQSIFSFQGADVTVFGRAREQLSGSALTMTMNRRSDRAVIEMVNTVFSKVMRIEKDGQKAGHSNLPEQSDGRINALLERALETIETAAVDEGYMTAYTPLEVDPDRKGAGNVELLLTPIDATNEACELECDESEQELRHIASYIKQAVETDIHPEVKAAYEKNDKAIAVLFDTRKQMLQLHRKLAELGIAAKVADSGNFYDTKEVNDIFIVLKLLTMLPFKDTEALTPRQKYVLAGALRSNIIRMNGDGIDTALQGGELPEILQRWRMRSVSKNPAELIDTIVKESGVMHVYRQLENYAQREANVEQLIAMADDFAVHNGGELYAFVRELERLIHDEMASEEEAFVIEEGVGSIEIRTIHSSKGLEWPMVILGSTQRSFMGMQPSESMVFDDFDGHAIVGFKVGDYKPLAYRFVKERTKRKHIEERKRLLYVAMTRPENTLVISTVLTKTDKGVRLCGRCGENNYFSLINQSLDVELEQLWEGEVERNDDIKVRYPLPWEGKESTIKNMPVCEPPKLKPLTFTDRRIVRPSGTPDVLRFLEPDAFDAASAGTAVHKIIEKCWRNLDDDACMKRWMDEFDVPESWRWQIVKMARAFKHSPHYEKVMNGAEAYFEYDFTYLDENGQRVYGSIDLLYWDEEKGGWVIVDFKTTALGDSTPEDVMKAHGYDRQLELYARFVEEVAGQKVASREICWLGALAKFS
jgi:ATP-dependent helicase/nuclease subunit A